jgi:hypothetical protein
VDVGADPRKRIPALSFQSRERQGRGTQ